MSTQIRLGQKTSTADILAWPISDSMEIIIHRSSGFEVGAQGLALSMLRAVLVKKLALTVVCDYQEPKTEKELADTIFSTPFGFSVARLASSIQFRGGLTKSSDAFKVLLATYYRSGDGCIGDGKQKALICVDPRYPLPPLLQGLSDAGDDIDFPSPSSFAKVLHYMAENMGFSQLLSSNTESPIISYIYELVRNTCEHGVPQTGSHRSTRAMILEKIVLQKNDLASRRMSDELKAYLLRVSEDGSGPLGLGVMCVTISDQGDGIAFTLPPKFSGETVKERFVRAFNSGESRKSQGVINRGLGLANALIAAHRLNAMIQVWSGTFFYVHDFTDGELKYSSVEPASVSELSDATRVGTSISIFIPEHANSPDQKMLFKV